MNTPLISVVIPVYNAQKFLEKCLEHLIHQTYKNIEIIIVDDGSTDNCANIYNAYAKQDSRIKIIRQTNAGPSVALNTGLDIARGQYVHFHDHDDYVNLDYFEKMANAAILTQSDIMCGEVNQPEYNFPRFDSIEICVSLRDKILKTRANKFNPAWRYLYKKEFLDKTGLRFNPDIFGAQDLFFTKPAIVLAHTVATVPDAIYNVVDTDTALGKSTRVLKRKKATPAFQRAKQEYKKFMDEHGATDLINTPEKPYHVKTLQVFNIPITRQEILHNKIRYYIFGINIGTRHII